jgi:hypothetical protein
MDILVSGTAKTTLSLLKCMQEKKLEEINIMNQLRHREALLLEQQLNQSKLFGGSFKKHITPNTNSIDKLSTVGSGKYKSPQRRAELDDADFTRDIASNSRESLNAERSNSPKKAPVHIPIEKRLYDSLQAQFSGT